MCYDNPKFLWCPLLKHPNRYQGIKGMPRQLWTQTACEGLWQHTTDHLTDVKIVSGLENAAHHPRIFNLVSLCTKRPDSRSLQKTITWCQEITCNTKSRENAGRCVCQKSCVTVHDIFHKNHKYLHVLYHTAFSLSAFAVCLLFWCPQEFWALRLTLFWTSLASLSISSC